VYTLRHRVVGRWAAPALFQVFQHLIQQTHGTPIQYIEAITTVANPSKLARVQGHEGAGLVAGVSWQAALTSKYPTCRGPLP
jgi:hypothetical protein